MLRQSLRPAKPVSAFAVLLVVGACAMPTTQKYQAVLDPWVGAPVDSLVLKWGPPSSSFKMGNGDNLLEFSRSDTELRGGEIWTKPVRTRRGNYEEVVTYVTPPYAVKFYCKTRFLAGANGIIKSYSFEGNDCVAY